MTLITLMTLIAFPLRAVPPKVPQPRPIDFQIPKAQRFELSNKLPVYFVEDHELTQIQMTLMFHGGSIYDPAEKIGLVSIFAAVLPYGGTKWIKADALVRELELMGSSISSDANEEQINVQLFSLTKNFSRTLELFRQIVVAPSFDPSKLDIEKKKALEAVNRRNDEPWPIAGREFRRMVYGPASPWGRRTEKQTLSRISRGDLLRLHQIYFKPNNVILAVSGNISYEDLRRMLEEKLGESSWSNSFIETPKPPEGFSSSGRAVYLIAKETALESSVYLGLLGIARHDPDYFSVEVMNEILGGGFASRLFRNVRSRKGLAYAIGSGFTAPGVKGFLAAIIGPKAASTVEGINAVIEEIQMMKEAPPTDEELSAAKSQLIDSFIRNFATTHLSARRVASLEFFGYPSDYLENYTGNLSRVTPSDVIRVATQYWKPEAVIIVVVGNPKNFDRDLSVLGNVKILDAVSGQIQPYELQPKDGSQ